jgi:pSer/pThr/pTyr-binding forkhead associated (FHA) protein
VAAEAAQIAVRVAGQDHAIEPGRDYVLGSAADCDLVILGAGPHHARLRLDEDAVEVTDLGTGEGTWWNGQRIVDALARIGDALKLGSVEVALVEDDGRAFVVPLPQMRAAAVGRRQAAVRRAANALLRRRGNETFQGMMADELRRTPWVAASLLMHALLFLLLWLLLPADEQPARSRAGVVLGDSAAADPSEGPPPVPDVQVEIAAIEQELLSPLEEQPAAVEIAAEGLATSDDALRDNPRLARRRPSTRGALDGGGVQGVGSDGFQQAVADLRKSGLEIVFVFDSTGSMTRTIRETKNTISQMLSVLRELVPDARVGIVTYRDRGAREDYVVREVPLGADFWRVSNFMQFGGAEGGGDRPEDVRAGLRAAFAQPWSRGARRVVVLAGDAPPHAEDFSKLLAEVRHFAGDGRSFLHTLVTSPVSAGQDTHRDFSEIASAGKGSCEDLVAHDRVLQRVLTLAFGSQFDRDVDSVLRAVDERSARVDVKALDLARRGGPQLARALQEQPVPVTLLNALVRRPRRATAIELIDMLGQRNTPDHTRQAVAWVLQRLFDLPLPPIDLGNPEVLDKRELQRLRTRCDGLPE